MTDGVRTRRRRWILVILVVLVFPVGVVTVADFVHRVKARHWIRSVDKLCPLYDRIEQHAQENNNVPPQSLEELIDVGILGAEYLDRYDDRSGVRVRLCYCPVPTLEPDIGLYILFESHESPSKSWLVFAYPHGAITGGGASEGAFERVLQQQNRLHAQRGLRPCDCELAEGE